MRPGEHPVPGPASVTGARALLDQAARLGERDLAICVFTGDSSALASLAPPGISPADKARLHRLLLSSGMSVVEIQPRPTSATSTSTASCWRAARTGPRRS
jgi:glycerate-2-kinase